jgi:peptide/nickel transport system substrate-binding protein
MSQVQICEETKQVIRKNALQIGVKFLAVSMVLQLVTTGCGRPPRKTEETTKTPTTTAPVNPLATPVNPPYPGPYKTVVVDGVEYKQGRFPQGTYGGTLVKPLIASDPKTFNAWVSNDSTSSQVCGYMWSSLISVDPFNNQILPEMAASYEVLPDHLTYITHLRKGLKWSDGHPITAEDVAFTFNSIVAPGLGNASMRDVISVDGKMPTVTVVDELTNKFVTAKPFVPFLRQAGGIPIAPKHIIEPMLEGKNARKKFAGLWSPNDTDLKSLVTSGPFVITRYVPAQRVELQRTKNYYMVDPSGKQQLPYLDKIVLLFVNNVSTNLLKFKGLETDITQVRNRDSMELAKDQERLNFKLYNLGQDASVPFLMFNMNQRKNAKGKPYVEPYKSAWFNDVNFRQAINHALNRQAMVDGYLKGIGVPAYACEAPSSPFFNTDLKPIEPNVEYAMSLLTKSGFQKKPDGNLYDKDGHLVEVDILAGAGGTMAEAILQYTKTDLKKLGIKVNTQEQEFNVLIDKIQSQKDWQMCFFGLTGDPAEPSGGANVWRSDGRLHLFDQRDPNAAGKTIVTDARPWEKRIDELFDAGLQEFDPVKRKKIYQEYQQIIYDQAPLIYLIAPMDMVAARNTIGNYQPTSLAQSQTAQGLHNLEEIYKVPAKDAKGAKPAQ